MAVLGIGQHLLEKEAIAQTTGKVMAPKFEVDPIWPKPMPNNWVFGQTIGLGIDEKDQVWIIHRGNDPGNLDRTELAFPPPVAGRGGARGAAPVTEQPELNANQPMKVAECCFPAPPVVAFNPAGDVVYSWGGPQGHPDWPESNHGIIVDNKGNVWIGGNGRPDSHILKFTRDGKFVAKFGKKGARRDPSNPNQYVRGADDLENFGRVAKIFVDSQGQRGLRRRRLRQQARRRDRHGHRQDQALLGRLRQQAGRTPTRRRTTRRRRRRSSSARRCTAPSCRTTASSTSAIARTIASRSSRRTASS